MSNLSRAGINELITTYKNTYLENPAIMVSGYTQELQTVEDYEGRQLLELIQNADDAKSDCIDIVLDRINHILSVANNGDSFTLEGIESLMYTGLSTKNKEEFIGNKGLGFRSILSWVNKVTILTKEIGIGFSKAYSEEFYIQHLVTSSKVLERTKKEIESKKLPKETKLIAALAFPEVLDEAVLDFVTKIKMDFNPGFLSKIENQINAISEELLLFLPNVKTIKVTVDGEVVKELTKSLDNNHQVIINDTHWRIHRSERKIFTGKDKKTTHKYQYGIAWKEDLSITDGRFYTYFPTDIDTNLPCIIHATFDLNNSRKEINETEANKHILQDIVEALGDITEQFIKKNEVDWDAFTFLKVTTKLNKNVLAEFYTRLNEVRESIGVYPTVDNIYILKKDALYHGAAFSTWVQENNFGNYFPKLLVAKKENLSYIKYCYFSPLQLKEIVETINSLLTIEQRVQLIGFFAKNVDGEFNTLHESNVLLPLILNNKNEVISEDIRVFTKNTEGDDLKFPTYIQNIEFIDVSLYEHIKYKFRHEIGIIKNKNNDSSDARALKHLLESVINIGLDDITGVIQHVISETNKILKVTDNQSEIVRAMVNSLYSIFISNKERRGNLSSINKIPLIANDGSIQNSENLYFGEGYSIGFTSTLIFEGIRQDSEYLANPIIYNLIGNEDDIINFFKWLNVNVISKVIEKSEKHLYLDRHDGYTNYVLATQENTSSYCHKYYEVKSIDKLLEILSHKNLSIDKLIAWVALDSKFRNQLTLEHTDKFRISYNNGVTHFSNFPSCIQFEIDQSRVLENTIANPQLQGIQQLKVVDLECELFKTLALKSEDIQKAIRLLKISTSLNDLSPDLIYHLMKDFSSKSDGANSQTFYKLMYEYFRDNEETQLEKYTPNFEGIHYIARKGGQGKEFKLLPYDKVYYSDNKLLPQAVLDNYWFVNLPKRIGENRVRVFFGVKLIKDIIGSIEIKVDTVNDFNRDLNNYINRLKPYFLAYRLKSLTKNDDKKYAVNSLKKAQFHLVSKASYTEGNSTQMNLKDYDFIPKDDVYTILYSINSNLQTFQNDPHFCDTIAEIICVVFKVGDLKNTFRRIFKDGISETKHILHTDEEEYLLADAFQLLGISQVELNFWKQIFPQEQLELDFNEDLRQVLANKIGNTLPDTYQLINFEDWNSNEAILFLKWLKDMISTIELDKLLPEYGLERWHKRQLENHLSSLDQKVKQSLWLKANEGNLELKKKFIPAYFEYQNAIQSDSFNEFLKVNRFSLDLEYEIEIQKFCQSKFDLQILSEMDIDVRMHHETTFSKDDNVFALVDDMKKTLKDGAIEIYSLLYFEGTEYEEIIDDKLKELARQFKKSNTENRHNIVNDEVYTATFGKMKTKDVTHSRNNNQNKKTGSVTEKTNRESVKKGLESENKVKVYLNQNNYDFIPISETTDSFHYDFKYKKKDDSEWRYLEVKTDSGGYFYLSNKERETGMDIQYKDRFDIAVVNGKHIQFFISPFVVKEDAQFKAIPNDYIVYFEIDQH